MWVFPLCQLGVVGDSAKEFVVMLRPAINVTIAAASRVADLFI
jgi:hypothetical protein